MNLEDELTYALHDLSIRLGEQSVDEDQHDLHAEIDTFLTSPPGQLLISASSTLTSSPSSHKLMSNLLLNPISSQYNNNNNNNSNNNSNNGSSSNMYEPQRINTALACAFLESIRGEMKSFGHLETVCNELYGFIYKDFSPSSSSSSSTSNNNNSKGVKTFLHSTPYFELARSLRVHVTRLESERLDLETEESHLLIRRQVRKRVIRRLIQERQRQLIDVFFGQWRATVSKIKEKRVELMKWFRRLTKVKVSDVFKAWHAFVVKEQLERAKREKAEYEWMMGTLTEDLSDAIATEKKLEEELRFGKEEQIRLDCEIEITTAAIYNQKVPETMEVVNAMGEALVYIGNTALSNIEPMLDEIASAPDFQKIAKMFWSDREEEVNSKDDIKVIEFEAGARDEREVRRKKIEERDAKLTAKEEKMSEKESATAADYAQLEGEEAYKLAIEESNGAKKFKREEMDAAGLKAAKSASDKVKRMYTDRYKARVKKNADDLADKLKLYKVEQVKNEVKWHEQRKLNDPDHTDDEVNFAMNALTVTLNEDEVLLLWIKYHLRRSTRSGYGHRRKVSNYNEDLRDGVNYGVLLKRIGYHVFDPIADGSMDDEIDPTVRIDTVMKQSGRLEPPATAFNTRGHVLGNDSFLNAAMLSRLMITHSGLNVESHDDVDKNDDNDDSAGSTSSSASNFSPLSQCKAEYASIKMRWESSRLLVAQMSKWDTWVQLRSVSSDLQLSAILSEIDLISVDLAKLHSKLTPLQVYARKSQKLWWPIKNRIQQWSWKLFAVKVKQEDEAPNGVDIDVLDGEKNHAPFKLVDRRFEKNFAKFTCLQKGRMKTLLDYTQFFDRYKEEEVRKKLRIEQLCKEEKRKMFDLEDQINDYEISVIKAGITPVDDDTLDLIHSKLETIFRKNYFDISRIFKYYAAGGEGGLATDISISEWWQLGNDCQYVGGKDPNHIGKTDIERCFNETETPEEVVRAENKRALKERVVSKVEEDLNLKDGEEEEEEEDYEGQGESNDKKEEKDKDKKKKNTEEEDYYENEFEWELAADEREIGPEPFIEGLVRVAFYKFRDREKTTPMSEKKEKEPDRGFSKRLEKLIEDFLIPNACKSNTDTFRGELSLDEVQLVFKNLKPQIMKIFHFYARVHEPIPGAAPQEPSMDGPLYMKFCKDSRLVTRKGDLRHDFPELSCRKVFNDTQTEEDEDGGIDAGGGADQMIYMEYLEALGAIACFKFPNPYIPLQIKVDDMLKNIVFPAQERFALKGMKKKTMAIKKVAK